ncbi:hypothetical protein FOL47_008881, partial [Perkinsus chesapeaki]
MSAGSRLHIPPVSAEYTALEGKIEHIERVCRLELEQHTRKCRAELTERIDDVVSYIARNLSSDSRNSSARLKDISADMASVKIEVRKTHGMKEAVEELTEKMKAMQSDIDALMRRNGSARSRSQVRAPSLESVEGHKELKIVIDECLNLTKRVKALERSRYGSGGNGSPRVSHHTAPSEADTEVRTLGEEVRQCLAATVDLRRYIDSSIGKVERRMEASERSSGGGGSPNGLDTMSTLPAVVGPEVTNLQSALEALGDQVAEVKTIREDMSRRLASVEQAVNEFGASNRRADSKSSRLGEGLERNQEQLEILRENLAETRRVVSEAVAADSPQLISRITALCEEKVSALADSLFHRPEVSERFHRIEAKMNRDVAGRYDAMTRSLDMLKEVVRQRDERQVQFDGQLREQKANISESWDTATRALAEFKEDLAEMGSLKSRECDELKADLTDMRLSLARGALLVNGGAKGSLERRCELKMEEVERRQKRQLEDMIGPVRRQAEEEHMRADKGAREEIKRMEGKLEKACRERAEGMEAAMRELVQKGRAELLAEVHLEIMEVERKVMVKSSKEVERMEERLEKMEGRIKRRGSSGGSRVVTITSSPEGHSSSSEESYDEMHRDIKYDNISSRVKEIGGRMVRVEKRIDEISAGQMALAEEIDTKVDAASTALRQEIETNRKRGATAVEEMGRLGQQIREVLEERAGIMGKLEEMKGDIKEGREISLKALEDMERSMRAAAEGERLMERVEDIDKRVKGVDAALEGIKERIEGSDAVDRMDECYKRMEEMEGRVDSLVAREKSQAEEIEALELHVESLDGVKDTLEKVIDKIRDEVGSLRLSVGEVSGLQTTVEEMSSFLSKFPRDGFKEDVQRSIEGLRSGLAEVRAEMEEVRGVRQEIGKMGEVESRLGHVEANVEWIEGEMNSYKKGLEGVDGQMAEQGKALDGLTAAVAAVEKETAEKREVNKDMVEEEGIGGRLQELEDSVTELMALLGVVDELAKNQTEMRKSLQSRCDKQASDLAGELREEMERLKEDIERERDAKVKEMEENRQRGEIEEVKGVSEEIIGRVKDMEERVVELERRRAGGQEGESSVGVAAMKAQIAELEDAVGGAQERVEEMIEAKLEKLQAELVESDSEWQRMVEEQVSAALGHLESEVDPQLTKLGESMREVMERVRSAEASAGELFGLRKEVGILRRKVEEEKATGPGGESGGGFIVDRLAACEDAIKEAVKCAGEVEGLRKALGEISQAVSRHEGALAAAERRSSPKREGGVREGEQEATIAEMQKAIQTVHSRMCRLASAIRELYSDCRTSLSNNFPEAAAAGDGGCGLDIPDWSDESILATNQLNSAPHQRHTIALDEAALSEVRVLQEEEVGVDSIVVDECVEDIEARSSSRAAAAGRGGPGEEGLVYKTGRLRQIFCAGLPVFLANPDGSLSEGRPYGYRDPTPPRTPREGFMTAADISARLFGDVLGGGDPLVVSEELTLLYERHRTAFAILLVVQAVIEALFLAYHIHHSALAIHDISTMYRTSSHKLVTVVFWSVMAAEMVYMTVYLAIGFWSIYTHRAKHYGYFSTCCLTGIVGHVLLAYANQFNLIIFFLRLTSYIYG